MNDNNRTRWIALRTAPARTLPLTDSLLGAGIEAWTPRQTSVKRLPRGRKGTVARVGPIVPSIVFVRVHHFPELMTIAGLPVSPHPPFSFFRYDGRIPEIPDHQLDALRAEERKAMPKAERRVFAPRDTVHVPEGSLAFAGLTGIVEESDAEATRVCFGGLLTVSIKTWRLESSDVEGDPA